jgi:hypothetical protein
VGAGPEGGGNTVNSGAWLSRRFARKAGRSFDRPVHHGAEGNQTPSMGRSTASRRGAGSSVAAGDVTQSGRDGEARRRDGHVAQVGMFVLAGRLNERPSLWTGCLPRRVWATERKDLPLEDVAAVGGWRDTSTLLQYQQPDEATMRSVAEFERPPEQSLTTTQAVSNSHTYSHTPRKYASCPSWARAAGDLLGSTRTFLIQSPVAQAHISDNLLGIGHFPSIGARFPAVVCPAHARRNYGKTTALGGYCGTTARYGHLP